MSEEKSLIEQRHEIMGEAADAIRRLLIHHGIDVDTAQEPVMVGEGLGEILSGLVHQLNAIGACDLNVLVRDEAEGRVLVRRSFRELLDELGHANEALEACRTEANARIRSLEADLALAREVGAIAEWIKQEQPNIQFEFLVDMSGGEEVCYVTVGNPSTTFSGSSLEQAVSRAMEAHRLDLNTDNIHERERDALLGLAKMIQAAYEKPEWVEGDTLEAVMEEVAWASKGNIEPHWEERGRVALRNVRAQTAPSSRPGGSHHED